jgi:ABC-type polysaccharide/polyol phosphate export permease
VLANFLPALYPLFIISTLFIFLGMCIGYLFHSSETATLGALFVVSISMLLSNTVLPIESIPIYLQHIIGYNPFVVGEIALKKLMLFDFGIGEISESIIILWITTIIFIILSYIFMKIYKRRANK